MPIKKHRGGTLLGFILGLLVGLGAALAVAVYVTKVPIPLVDRGLQPRPDQDAQEQMRNRDWNPNAGLASKTVVGAEYNKVRFNVDSNAPYNDVGGDYIDPWQPEPGWFHSASPLRPPTAARARPVTARTPRGRRASRRPSMLRADAISHDRGTR